MACPFLKALTMEVKPIHSNIKVGTIVNIMKVNAEHLRKINFQQKQCDYFKEHEFYPELLIAQLELKKEQDKYAQFLNFYI